MKFLVLEAFVTVGLIVCYYVYWWVALDNSISVHVYLSAIMFGGGEKYQCA